MNVRDAALTLARRAADGLLSVVVAPRCAACGAPLDAPSAGPVCAVCWDAVELISSPLCDVCGDPLPGWRNISRELCICARCRRGGRSVSHSRAAGPYDGSLRAIIHAFKYEGRRSLAAGLAALMRAQGRDVLAGADCAVPVPLHWRRRRARGFNQAADLASHLGLPVWDVLRRVRGTRPQVDLPAAQRHRNVRGAFAVAGMRWRPHRRLAIRRAVRDRTVLLVDDVSTTGATLAACARVLRAAGAREVRALTVARVAATRPSAPPQPPLASGARRQS
jgi:ComF family protein